MKKLPILALAALCTVRDPVSRLNVSNRTCVVDLGCDCTLVGDCENPGCTGAASIIPIAQVVREVGISLFNTIGLVSPAPAATPSEDELAARAVLSRNEWIRKIPHVVGVGLEGLNDGGIGILISVDSKSHIREVEGQVPSQLEGFPVEVIPYHQEATYL
jgi:hypothetical protein